jgi:methanogenic corrinoid protein MtbC1
MEGWDTYYLGANTPAESIIISVLEHGADVLAISATLTAHLGAVADLIALIRSHEPAMSVKIMVGGYPFNHSADLWRGMGADGCASDAQEAIRVAKGLATGD